MGKESHSRTLLKCGGTVASNQAGNSHNRTENKPARTPRDREVYFAEVIRKERREIIKVAIRRYVRWFALKGRKTQAEVVSETVRESARTKHAKFVGKLAMNRVDVVIEVYSSEVAESGVA